MLCCISISLPLRYFKSHTTHTLSLKARQIICVIRSVITGLPSVNHNSFFSHASPSISLLGVPSNPSAVAETFSLCVPDTSSSNQNPRLEQTDDPPVEAVGSCGEINGASDIAMEWEDFSKKKRPHTQTESANVTKRSGTFTPSMTNCQGCPNRLMKW